MTDRKMEPWMLRDLADIFERGEASSDSEALRQEAARREAEAAKPDEWQTMRGHVPLIRCPGGVNTCTGYDCLTAGCKRGERGIPQGEREGPDSAADDMLYQRIVFAEKAVHMDYLTVGFTLADVRDAQSAMRNAAKKLRVEGYPATADDLDHHANLLDGGAK